METKEMNQEREAIKKVIKLAAARADRMNMEKEILKDYLSFCFDSNETNEEVIWQSYTIRNKGW